MVDRKARTDTLKLPITATIVDLKKGLDKESLRANPTVIQDLGAGQYLVEFEDKNKPKSLLIVVSTSLKFISNVALHRAIISMLVSLAYAPMLATKLFSKPLKNSAK